MRRTPLRRPASANATWPSTITSRPPWTAETITSTPCVARAARALGMPKSSASRALARLEAVAGSALIERSTRHLHLTDAGRLLQRHARRILDDVGEAENAMTGLIGVPRGTLRVSVGF